MEKVETAVTKPLKTAVLHTKSNHLRTKLNYHETFALCTSRSKHTLYCFSTFAYAYEGQSDPVD